MANLTVIATVIGVLILIIVYFILFYKENFCGNLFSDCKLNCPQGFTSYAIPGIQTRNKIMRIDTTKR